MDIEQAKRILGITEEDDGRTAKLKFRRLIGQYHPDAAGADSKEFHERAQKINAAYSLLKKEDFFLTRAVTETIWKEMINESVFTDRNVYAPYHMDIETGGLYQTVAKGKYMWDPDEEEFPLFLRSVYHAASELLDAAEAECGVCKDIDAFRISSQERLFHCLAMQFVEPAKCLRKIAQPEKVDRENRKIYRFRAYIGEKKRPEIMRRIAALQISESVYPAALQNGRLVLADKEGGSLGHLSFMEDELYYCLFPLMSAHMVQIRMAVKQVQANQGSHLRFAKAEIEFLIRLDREADNYRNPDMNKRIEKILSDYRNQIRREA